MRIRLENIIFDKLGLKHKNWKQIKLLQKNQDKKLKIKKIRTKVEILTTKRVKLYLLRDERKKNEKLLISDKSDHQQRHAPHQQEKKTMVLSMRVRWYF
jgi:hypothetical protein